MSNRIRIKFGQIEFEAEGDSEIIERERQQFFSLLPHAVAMVSPIVSVIEQPKATQITGINTEEVPMLDSTNSGEIKVYESLAALFRDKSFSTDIEKIMGTAYYLDQIKGITPFNVKDIETALSESREPKPTNINSCINLNINKALIIPVKEKKDGQKSFKVSSDGINWVNTYSPSERKNKSTLVKKKISKSMPLSSYNSVTREELNLDKYPQVERLAKFKEKMLMIMYIFMQEQKGEYFTVGDIMYIMTNIFGEKATVDQVKGVFKNEPIWFNKIKDESNKKSMKYKMLNRATDFVNTIFEKISK